MNRFHILNPTPFERSLRLDLEAWHRSPVGFPRDWVCCNCERKNSGCPWTQLGYYRPVLLNSALSDIHGHRLRRTGLGTIASLLFASAIACAFTFAPTTAFAAAQRIALLPPIESDPADTPVRAKIIKALKQHKLQVVADAPVKDAVKKSPPSSDDDYVNLARKLNVGGLIEATVSQTGSNRRVEIVVRNGADGSVAGRETFSAKGPPTRLAAAVAGSFWKKLGSTFKNTSPPSKGESGEGLAARDLSPTDDLRGAGSTTESAGEPAKSAEPKTGAPARADDEEKPTRPRTGAKESEDGGNARTLRFLEVEADVRFLRRVFQYVPPSAAGPYTLKFVPVVGGHVSWCPITYAGIFASAEFTASLITGVYPTATREIIVGAQGRIPFSIGQVGASVAYFEHAFIILDTPSTTDAFRSTLPTPDTVYQGARFAVNARLRLLDHLILGVEGAYRLVTNPGQGTNRVRSPQYFPNGIVTAGVDGAAFVGVNIKQYLEIRAGVDFRRYVLGRLQGAKINASGGATDDYLAFSLGVLGVFGGK